MTQAVDDPDEPECGGVSTEIVRNIVSSGDSAYYQVAPHPGGALVTLSLMGADGKPAPYPLEFYPEEARQVADALRQTADEIESRRMP